MLYDRFLEMVNEIDRDPLLHSMITARGFDGSWFNDCIVFRADNIRDKANMMLGEQRAVKYEDLLAAKFYGLRMPFPQIAFEFKLDSWKRTPQQIRDGVRSVDTALVVLWAKDDLDDPDDPHKFYGTLLYGLNGYPMAGGWLFEVSLDEHFELEAVRMKINHAKLKTQEETAKEFAYYHLYVTFMAISLLHCRNVEYIEHGQPYTRAMRRRGEPQPVIYRTLKIKAMRSRYESTEHEQSSHSKRRLHVVRGHFKEYTEQAPLFGKYSGRYWWEAQARGEIEQGTVIKSYEIEG